MQTKKITIKMKKKGVFQVIGRNIEVSENSTQSMSTIFYADTKEEFNMNLNKIMNEYQLFKVVTGQNIKNETIVMLLGE